MKSVILTLLSLTAPLLADTNASYPPNPFDSRGEASPAVSEANASAIHWLTLIDQRAYGGAWLEAGSLFRDVISQKQWTAAMSTIRSPLGTVSARKLTSHQQTNSLRYGTKGNFMVLKFDTQFSKKSSATETVTLMSDEIPTRILSTNPATTETTLHEGTIGQWKVISYNID